MFEDLIIFLQANPYLGVAVVFVLCGVGLPVPEEIALLAAGYICFLAPTQGFEADLLTMILVCATATLAGDIIPFYFGKTFGPRLLRLRFLRFIVTRGRLAIFDRWFRRRGDMVIFLARFIPGLRVVAFFTAGTMQMRWLRFLFLDGLGIMIVSPTFVWIGYSLGEVIDSAVAHILQIERGLKYLLIGGGVLAGLWWWLRRRKRKRVLLSGPKEAFVEPTPADGQSTRDASNREDDPEAASASAGEPPGAASDEGRVIPGPGSANDKPDGGNVSSS